MAAPTAERPAAAREPLLGRWRPRSLQSRQLLAASLGLLGASLMILSTRRRRA